MGAVGICGSDSEVFAGTRPRPAHPRLLGHEFAGEVVATEGRWTGVPVGTESPWTRLGCAPSAMPV